MKFKCKDLLSNTLFLVIITAVLTFWTSKYLYDKQHQDAEFDRLNDNLNKILDKNFDYPYIDDSTFVAWWSLHKYSNNDSALRYENYCEYTFNFMQDVCDYYNYDTADIKTFIDVEGLIENQRGWWLLPDQQDSKAYPDKFKKFMNYYYNH